MPYHLQLRFVLFAAGLPLACHDHAPPVAGVALQATGQTRTDQPLVDEATWKRWTTADYLVVAPAEFAEALAPLIAHRESLGHAVALLSTEQIYRRFSHGEPSAEAIRTAVLHVEKQSGGRLQFLFLIGDVNAREEGADTDRSLSLPTHYLRKVEYEHHRADEHEHEFPFVQTGHDHANEEFPSDRPYGLVANQRRISVGRLPARTAAEVRGYVQKLVAYEAQSGAGAWRRRLVVTAGPANFGALADGAIEAIATEMLDQTVSYDFDIRFTFAKEGSPYAGRLDQLHSRWRSNLETGSLIAAYIGHGSAHGFDDAHFRGRHYFIGTREDAELLKIPLGNPLFLSITCNTGAFDLPSGQRSMAEAMVLNPSGAIAVYAASRETHPYPNALLGQAAIEQFVNRRPRTVGEGLEAAMATARKASIPLAELLLDTEIEPLKKEHEGLYNLFGDPGIRLQYASPVALVRAGAGSDLTPGAKFIVDANASESAMHGRAFFTLETPRSVIRGHLIEPSIISVAPNDGAFLAMEKNWQTANDKTIATRNTDVVNGKAQVEFSAPSKPGRYLVKVLFESDKSAAIGHLALNVK